jgi:hypothetical protein
MVRGRAWTSPVIATARARGAFLSAPRVLSHRDGTEVKPGPHMKDAVDAGAGK